MPLWTFSNAVKQKSSSELLLLELLWLAAIGALQASASSANLGHPSVLSVAGTPLVLYGHDLVHMHGLLCLHYAHTLAQACCQAPMLRQAYTMCKLGCLLSLGVHGMCVHRAASRSDGCLVGCI